MNEGLCARSGKSKWPLRARHTAGSRSVYLSSRLEEEEEEEVLNSWWLNKERFGMMVQRGREERSGTPGSSLDGSWCETKMI